MTLLEMLSKELPNRGGWPEGHQWIATDRIGNVMAYVLNGRISGRNMFLLFNGDGIVTREQYEAAVKPVWNGEGLPPVGEVAESFIGGEWREVKVVYVGEPGSKNEALVFDVITTKPAWADEFRLIRTEGERLKIEEAMDKLICMGVLDPVSSYHADKYFRLIRTEAERKREEAIAKMAATPKPCGYAIYDICAQLYDAGYRKMETSDD